MSEPNWEEAPEGFDYWIESKGIKSDFHRKEGIRYYDTERGNYYIDSKEIKVTKRPEPEEWNTQTVYTTGKEWDGDVPPPVGTVCEAKALYGSDPSWVEVEVLKVFDDKCAVIMDGVTLCWATEFRPIKTEEEKAVDEMSKIIWGAPNCHAAQAKALYRVGYRKV